MFAENAEFLKAEANSRAPALKVMHGDIRDKDAITGDAFDVYYLFDMQNYIFLQCWQIFYTACEMLPYMQCRHLRSAKHLMQLHDMLITF